MNIKKIKLLHQKLLVRRKSKEQVTESGIFMPIFDKSDRQELGFGVVIKGNKDFPKDTEIIFNKFSGYDVDEEYVALDPLDILAIYDRDML